MSTLSARLRDRVNRMRLGRHLGNAKPETIAAWAKEAEELEADRRKLAALVEGLRGLRADFRRLAGEACNLPPEETTPWHFSLDARADAFRDYDHRVEVLLLAHGFGPDAQGVQEAAQEAAGGVPGAEAGKGA